MKSISLFDKKKRLDSRASFGNENSFDYFNNSGRPDIIPIREMMDYWFSFYPDEERTELKRRFISDFGATFYELAMYNYFREMGYNITIHPLLENTSKRPDFLLEKDGKSFFVEIKETRLKSGVEATHEKKLNTLYDSMNKIDSRSFFLLLNSIDLKNGKQPSGKNVVRYFNEKIALYDTPDFWNHVESGSLNQQPIIYYDDEVITIKAKLLPKTVNKGEQSARAIGSYPLSVKFGGDENIIHEALKVKAGRYGAMDSPYLICLNYPSSFLDEEDVNRALYGVFPHDSEKSTGFFGNRSNPRHTRVSAIMITAFTISGLTNPKIYYHRNPYAKEKLRFTPSEDFQRLFNLSDDYLQKFSKL